MKIIISVWRDLPYWVVGFVKGGAELVFDSNMDKDELLERAAEAAIEFDTDLLVMGQLVDPYEIRDNDDKD